MIAAIYCRLSKEDEDRALESESIQNQKSLLVQYARERGWEICQIFCDEDYSGMDRERPAFRQLIAQAQQGRFDVVLVKTQSRFTRDMELVEKYIHGLFPLWGIRFVAVVDHVDTDVKGNKKARQINGLINEWYLEDLSENIRAVLDYKRRTGQYIGGFAIYGYQKDPADKNRLLVDPEAAQVVRTIFRLYLSGHGKQHITQLLNEQGLPNPTRYKQLHGCGYVNGAQTDDSGRWNRTTVGRILRERMYTGDLVQGRRKKASYKSKQLLSVPREDWVVVPGTHEAIIDKDTFATVQRLLGERTRTTGTGQVHLLAGKVRCMDCGSVMVKVSNTYRGERRCYLRCQRYAADTSRCSSHSIRLDTLEAQVSSLLLQYIAQYFDSSCLERWMAHGPLKRDSAALQREITALTLEVERRSKAIRDLYLDKSQGLLDQAQFQALSQGYWTERSQLQARLSVLSGQIAQPGDMENNRITLRNRMEQALGEVTRPLVAGFIEAVQVGQRDPVTGTQPICIHWLI